MPDSNGYPTEAELDHIRTWPEEDPAGWLAYVKTLWHFAEWGWREFDQVLHVSTGGWSGNEDVIAAMTEHPVLWAKTWKSTRRGGHYVFWRAPHA